MSTKYRHTVNSPTAGVQASTTALADLFEVVIGNDRAYQNMLLSVENTNTGHALADFELQVKANADAAYAVLLTGAGWNSAGVDKPLEFLVGSRIDTTAASATNGAAVRIRAPYALKFKGKSAASVLANGTFTGNATGWTLGSGFAYGTNNVAGTTASATMKQEAANMTTPWTDGEDYLVTFTITRSAGSLTVGTNTDADQGTTYSAAGTYTATVTADGHADGLVFTGTGFTGTIDSITAVPIITLNVRGSLS